MIKIIFLVLLSLSAFADDNDKQIKKPKCVKPDGATAFCLVLRESGETSEMCKKVLHQWDRQIVDGYKACRDQLEDEDFDE